MSGGVDSSVAAALLAEQGYEVVGVTLQLYDHGLAAGRKGACCAGQDIHDARSVAQRLGIPHYVLDFEKRFSESVITDFADSYLRGETPIPCVRCNQEVKFGDLMTFARDLKAGALVTGHYARRIDGPSGPALHRGSELGRDQSYFLFATTRKQLSFIQFPLGGCTKAEVRAQAARFSLEIAAKPDSQDICFVPDGSYGAVVARVRPEAVFPGEIIHVNGLALGRHNGIIHYTIGQRRGLGLSCRSGVNNEPLYVAHLDAVRNQVTVGPREALARTHIHIRNINWLADLPPPVTGLEVMVKLRSTQPEVAAILYLDPCGQAGRVVLSEPQYGVAPGQACVAYQGDRVLGGGWIVAGLGDAPKY